MSTGPANTRSKRRWGLIKQVATAKFDETVEVVMRLGVDLVSNDPTRGLTRISTSIDNMTPGNPFLETLADLPIDPSVTAHSIIPVLGDRPDFEDGDDGVVKYKSAHIEGVASELVVRNSGHSTQSTPKTIEEIRRILLLHAAAP